MDEHPAPSVVGDLAPLLLDPTRLRIVATLVGAGEVEFGFVRDRAGLTDSALSKQVKTLSGAGLVSQRRESAGPARRAWLRLTPHGRQVVATHTRALQTIATRAEPSAPSGETSAPIRHSQPENTGTARAQPDDTGDEN
jgi:DNA-binding MarR family transcriptional regulator